MKTFSFCLFLCQVTLTDGFNQLQSLASRQAFSTRWTSTLYATEDVAVLDSGRRNMLSSLLVAGSAGLLIGDENLRTSLCGATTTSDNGAYFLSVDKALEIIENQCDRRFLHAVVASDYCLMYKGMKQETPQGITLYNDETENLLQSGPNVFQKLEVQLRDRPIQPSTSHLAVANVNDAKKQGGQVVFSVWPLGGENNVHYAWMENEKTFQDAAVSGESKVIVDGIDCGRMSLEDALESGKEILFKADQYLMIPVSMEKELVAKLRGAFLI